MVHHEKNFRDMASVWKDVYKGMFLEKFGDPLHQKTCYIISKVMVIFLLKSWKQQWLTLYFLWGFFQKILCLVESVIQQNSHSLIQHQISQLTLSLINHQAKKFLADFFFLTREITAVCSWIQIYRNLKWSFDADQFLSTHTAQWAIFQEIWFLTQHALNGG